MRVFTFQDKRFVDEWFTVWDCYSDSTNIDYETIAHFCDWEYTLGASKKPIYNGKDFIYTFFNKSYQEPNNRIEFLNSTCINVYDTVRTFTSNHMNRAISLVELEVPDSVGIFGYLGKFFEDQAVLSRQEAFNSDRTCEYVLPFIKKDWVIEIYDVKLIVFNGIKVSSSDGMKLVPRFITNNNDKLSNKELMIVTSIKDSARDYSFNGNDYDDTEYNKAIKLLSPLLNKGVYNYEK